MADSAYGAPQSSGGGGIGGFFADNPWAKWVALGGVVAVAYVIVKRRQANAPQAELPATTATTTSGPVAAGGLTTDLSQIGSPGDIGTWTNSALRALGSVVNDPAVVENALFRFTNGLSLTAAQQAIVSRAIGVIGNPPGGPFPVISAPVPAAAQIAPPQGRYLNPVTWVWNKVAPATVAAGSSMFLNSLGFLGKGPIATPAAGNPIYARIKNSKGVYVWTRISSLAQYTSLGSGTQIATLKWSAPQPAVAA